MIVTLTLFDKPYQTMKKTVIQSLKMIHLLQTPMVPRGHLNKNGLHEFVLRTLPQWNVA